MIDATQLPAFAALEPKKHYPAFATPELVFGMGIVLSELVSVGR